MKRAAVLGSTGSVGAQALDVLDRLGGAYEVVALAAGHRSDAFAAQVQRWRPELAALGAEEPPDLVIGDVPILCGPDALDRLVERVAPDLLLLATPGLVGLTACLRTLRGGRMVAIANKESLVAAGHLVTRAAQEHQGTIIPVDSEHSGIWQCLSGEDVASVTGIVLTSSGGAFRDTLVEDLDRATPEQALRHPTWSMGPKITVDSATLMNKGLEIIEATWLFGVPASMVSVVLHRQSIVHALVEFSDGSVKAQLSVPDMRIPIVNALMYPDRVSVGLPRLDIPTLGSLTFEPLDVERYPALRLARTAAQSGGTCPAVLNAANDVAVDRFLGGEIRFTDIVPLVAETLQRHDRLLDRAAGDELVHGNRPILADAMRAIGSLILDRRVPPRVHVDHIVGSR